MFASLYSWAELKKQYRNFSIVAPMKSLQYAKSVKLARNYDMDHRVRLSYVTNQCFNADNVELSEIPYKL